MKTGRPIRSFVHREGRLTDAQHRALTALWPRYGLDPNVPLFDPRAVFGRVAPWVVEVGFGNGEALLTMAALAPETNFLGVEVYRSGVGRLLRGLERHRLTNVRVLCEDAAEVVCRRLPEASVDKLLLFFPDPWPKRRHHKRRLIQPGFVEGVCRALKLGGIFHVVTDWQDYAEHTLRVMAAVPALSNVAGPGRYASRPPYRPETKFERRGRRLGHPIRDLMFERQA